jgi:hypothetical protein
MSCIVGNWRTIVPVIFYTFPDFNIYRNNSTLFQYLFQQIDFQYLVKFTSDVFFNETEISIHVICISANFYFIKSDKCYVRHKISNIVHSLTQKNTLQHLDNIIMSEKTTMICNGALFDTSWLWNVTPTRLRSRHVFVCRWMLCTTLWNNKEKKNCRRMTRQILA